MILFSSVYSQQRYNNYFIKDIRVMFLLDIDEKAWEALHVRETKAAQAMSHLSIRTV